MKSITALFVILLAAASVTIAQPASEVWLTVRDQVSINGTIESNGWTFVSRAVAMSGDSEDDLVEESNLEFDILEEIRILASPDIEVDFEVDSEARSYRIALFLPAVQIHGIMQIESSHENDMIRVVYAVPSEELKVDPVSAGAISEMIKGHLAKPLDNDRGQWSSPLVFVSDLSFDPSLQEQATARLIAGYADGLGGLIHGHMPFDIKRMWCDLPEVLDASSLVKLDDWSLLDILEHRPQDHELAVELRSRLEKNGLNALSARIDTPDPVQWGGAGSAEIISLFELSGQTKGTKLEAICRANGTLPFRSSQSDEDDSIAAHGAFFSDPPDFKKAANLLIRSIENQPTVENLNLLAACLIESEQPSLAVSVARQAWRAEPAHPYAGVNYLRAIFGSGQDVEQIESVMNSVRDNAVLDDWGNTQLESIMESIQRSQELQELQDTVKR